jgi:hypothetical protein
MAAMIDTHCRTSGLGARTEQYGPLLDELEARSPQLAAAFLDVAPAVAERIGDDRLSTWVAAGVHVATGGWTSLGLAVRFFEQSPRLLDLVSLDQLRSLTRTVATLAGPAPELADACLRDGERALSTLAPPHRAAYLDLLVVVAQRCWADVDRCLDRVPSLVEGLAPELGPDLLALGARGVVAGGAGTVTLLCDALETLAGLDPGIQRQLGDEAAGLRDAHPLVALEMLLGAPQVLERVPGEPASRWRAAGRELLDSPGGDERALAWFRLESAQGRDLLAELAGRVELADVAPLLRLYVQALAGEEVVVAPVATLTCRGIGWSADTRATTDGSSVYLPASIDTFDDHDGNFAAYKVHATLQAARLTFGSFRFQMGIDGTHLPASVHRRHPVDGAPTVPPMRAFYDCFPNRRLVAWLFALVEGTRIDACALREYPGIGPALHRLRNHAAMHRPVDASVSARHAFAEALLLESLGRPDLSPVPPTEEARDLLGIVGRRGATVQDTAEVTARLYDLLMALPATTPRRSSLRPPSGGEVTTDTVLDQPDFRGDFKPEIVQTIEWLDPFLDEADRVSLTREELEELLGGSVELQAGGALDSAEIQAMLDALEAEAAARVPTSDEPIPLEDGATDSDAQQRDEPDDEITWFHYDEWDFRAQDYLVDRCRLGERRAVDGTLERYEEFVEHHRSLVVQTRRRFEQLRPEAFRRINRLEDGSDIDLDESIAFHAEKLAGAGPLARFYTRRNKIVRDVAVALLLDQSASTREPVDDSRRVIDVVRDATMLMVEALEATGDTFGIYGFSGQGPEQVEFQVVKELGDPLDDDVRRRVAGIEPMGATRMGPAIRHAVGKLDVWPAKVKLLILVSDGRPEDDDYGPQRGEIDHPLHDTKRALVEAKRRRIEPFLITVDNQGNDYLAQMCGDLGYEVVADVESLPRRLTRLYRYLTAE